MVHSGMLGWRPQRDRPGGHGRSHPRHLALPCHILCTSVGVGGARRAASHPTRRSRGHPQLLMALKRCSTACRCTVPHRRRRPAGRPCCKAGWAAAAAVAAAAGGRHCHGSVWLFPVSSGSCQACMRACELCPAPRIPVAPPMWHWLRLHLAPGFRLGLQHLLTIPALASIQCPFRATVICAPVHQLLFHSVWT